MNTFSRMTIFLVATLLSTTAIAQRSGIQLGEPKKKLTEPQVQNLLKCKLVYKLKAGMTNAEAADAIDAGWDKMTQCLRAAALKEQQAK